MKRLRLLQLGHVKLTGEFEYLSKDLRWLCWHGFPLRYIPRNFFLNKLVAIDLKHSNLQLVWKEPQLLDRLKILNLSHSYYLTQTPDFSRLPNLEKLILKDCPQLSKVHSTIGDLKFLILVNLKDCKSLCHLPRSIYKLKSLKSLVLSGCSKIDKLEEDIMQMESLTSLMADNTAITQVPNSLVRSKSIRYVSLCGYEGLSRHVFPSLVLSLMSPSSNPMYKVFGHITSSLQSLSLGLSAKNYAKSKSRPSTSQITYTLTPTSQITHTQTPTRPSMSQITYTQTPTRPSTSLITYTETPTSQKTCIETPTLIDLQDSIHIAGSDNFTSSLVIQAGECSKATDTFTKSILQGWTNDGSSDCDCHFPGGIYPKWITFEGEGSSLFFKVPNSGNKLKGMTIHIIYSSSLVNLASECDLLSILIMNYTKNTIRPYKRDTTTSLKDEEWKGLMSNLEPGDEVEIVIVLGHRFTVKKTVAHLIFDEITDAKIMDCSLVPHNSQI
ncbi:Leucine-rich repeat domain superfamily [Sesbania bispinosa]|nr:Leucine-rich repeat domain superfamily [Sesbania bispinosa]